MLKGIFKVDETENLQCIYRIHYRSKILFNYNYLCCVQFAFLLFIIIDTPLCSDEWSIFMLTSKHLFFILLKWNLIPTTLTLTSYTYKVIFPYRLDLVS